MRALTSRVILLAATALLGIAAPAVIDAQSRSQKDSQPPSPAFRTDSITRVARLRTSSVVALHTVTRPLDSELLFVPPVQQGLGSGIVIDKGLILTNAHVVAGANVIHVATPDGDNIIATVVGSDPTLDLAVIRASHRLGLPSAPLGDSDRLRVGDWVVAIGNPLGLHHTVTTGIVSATRRTLDDSGVEFLQTDTALSPGSSGGPLLDLAGRVVGVNVGILSPGGQNVGLNVAIPVSLVKEVLPHLLAGPVLHGWIGVATTPLSSRGAAARRLSDGLVLSAITPGGPAERAGLVAGDIIIAIADEPSMALREFYRYVRRQAPGTVIRLDLWRNGQRLRVPVDVAQRVAVDEPRVPRYP